MAGVFNQYVYERLALALCWAAENDLHICFYTRGNSGYEVSSMIDQNGTGVIHYKYFLNKHEVATAVINVIEQAGFDWTKVIYSQNARYHSSYFGNQHSYIDSVLQEALDHEATINLRSLVNAPVAVYKMYIRCMDSPYVLMENFSPNLYHIEDVPESFIDTLFGNNAQHNTYKAMVSYYPHTAANSKHNNTVAATTITKPVGTEPQILLSGLQSSILEALKGWIPLYSDTFDLGPYSVDGLGNDLDPEAVQELKDAGYIGKVSCNTQGIGMWGITDKGIEALLP